MDCGKNMEMDCAWQFISTTGVSVFLTGKAGTGKTTFLRRLRELMPKRMVVLAPTGVAAINAGGQTIHSFFQLPLGPFVPGSRRDGDNKGYRMAEKKKSIIRTLDLLVIDEISMVRADTLDAVDDMLRRYRDRTRPFGGVQLLLIGDLMQLSPVVKPDEWHMLSPVYDTPYFFSSRALQSLRYVTIELKRIYRQQDSDFISLLAQVRDGCLTPGAVEVLNSRYIPGFIPDGDGWIRLTTHNAPANDYNTRRLEALPDAPRVFRAAVEGDFPELSYPADVSLTLKTGAQVMFVKNDPSPQHLYYNGKIGVVRGFDAQGAVLVDCEGGAETIKVEPVEWQNLKYNLDPVTKAIREEVAGTFRQYPLRLAWAITVHKSQGLTFDHAVLDINAAFAHGQVYVALSRCRTLRGLVLTEPLALHSVRTDTTVNSYIGDRLAETDDNIERLPQYRLEYTLQLLDEIYDFRSVTNALGWLTRVVDEHLSRQKPLWLETLKGAEAPARSALEDVAARFAVHYRAAVAASVSVTPQLADRISDSARYFSAKLHECFDELIAGAAISIGNKQVAEMYNNALAQLKTAVTAKVKVFDALGSRPFSVAAYLDIRAKAVLDDAKPQTRKAPKTPKAPKPPKASKVRDNGSADGSPSAPKARKQPTAMLTLEMYRQGMGPAQIAAARSLTESTIMSHLAALVEQGHIQASELVKPERCRRVLDAAATFSGAYTLSDIKALLPDDYTFGEIRISLASAPR